MPNFNVEDFHADHPFRLKDHNPKGRSGCDLDKKSAKLELEKVADRLSVLQTHLFAESQRSLLIVLQGMDTSGKDGTIKNVFSQTNPMGLKIANFRAPNDVERSHDYLWRVHSQLPERGNIGVFNRSHYGDVIAARVEGFITEQHCKRRYAHINEFERMLSEEGTTVLKFFLNISSEEQKERLLERVHNTEKHWKFSDNDLKTRRKWTQYLAAYEAAIESTHTEHAPWYIVPADSKWFRNLLVAETIVQQLEKMNPSLPKYNYHNEDIEIPDV
jgi:PPK2 family polyphosphate:nucleotide phosphotransferase